MIQTWCLLQVHEQGRTFVFFAESEEVLKDMEVFGFAAEHWNSRLLDGETGSDFQQIQGGQQIFQEQSAGLPESAGDAF
jgi:hypothetical protein